MLFFPIWSFSPVSEFVLLLIMAYFALITYFLENNDLLAVRPQTNLASLGFLLEGLGGGEVNPFITKKKLNLKFKSKGRRKKYSTF